MKVWIGIDNGVSGTIGVIKDDFADYFKMPVFETQDYTKTKKRINRIDRNKLKCILAETIMPSASMCNPLDAIVLIERPMVNPGRFKATASGLRALESTLNAIEDIQIPYQYIDSKQWQRELLPSGYKGPELKKVGIEVAKRMWPSLEFKPDADGILIAEYARRHF